MCVCQRRGRALEFSAMECIDLREQVLEGGDYNQAALAPVIQQALRNHKVHTRKAVITFPVKFPWIRTIEVPRVPQREMDQIVRLEVERLYLDSTVEKLVDYFVLENQENTAEDKTKVLSCAIPRNAVAPYIELLASANLDLVGIDLAEVSVLKLASLQGISMSDGITLILNFGMRSTDLMLIESNDLQLVRKISQGKSQLRERIKDEFAGDPTMLKAIEHPEFELPKEHISVSTEFVSGLLSEIRRSIEFYLTDIKRSEGNVTKVVLAGSGYWPANLQELLSQQLHLPLINLHFAQLPNVTVNSVFKPDFPALSVFAPAVGSVLKGVA